MRAIFGRRLCIVWIKSCGRYSMNLECLMIFWELTAGNTVTIIFDYRLCIAVDFSTLIESSGVKPNCRFLEYTMTSIVTVKSSTWKLSNSFRILNYTSQWSSYWIPIFLRWWLFRGITIFLAFSSYSINDRHPTIHQVLAEYFDQNHYYMHADLGKVFALSIYLFDVYEFQCLQRTWVWRFP